MKVKIGKYKSWFGPFQLANLLCFWVRDVRDEYGFKQKPNWVHDFGEWLAYGSVSKEARNLFDDDRETTWLFKLLSWIDSKRERKVSVHIDKWDTWSMDHTLALIVLPMLKQLKETKHGAPLVEDSDVPDELKSTSAPPKENEYDVDANHFKRWDYVLDEMIFAFEHIVDDTWESKFTTGNYDLRSEPCEWDDKGDPTLYQLKEGPSHTAKTDYDAIKIVQDRIDNGLRLFGVYYRSLWD